MSVQTMEQVSPFVFTLPLLTRNRTRPKGESSKSLLSFLLCSFFLLQIPTASLPPSSPKLPLNMSAYDYPPTASNVIGLATTSSTSVQIRDLVGAAYSQSQSLSLSDSAHSSGSHRSHSSNYPRPSRDETPPHNGPGVATYVRRPTKAQLVRTALAIASTRPILTFPLSCRKRPCLRILLAPSTSATAITSLSTLTGRRTASDGSASISAREPIRKDLVQSCKRLRSRWCLHSRFVLVSVCYIASYIHSYKHQSGRFTKNTIHDEKINSAPTRNA